MNFPQTFDLSSLLRRFATPPLPVPILETLCLKSGCPSFSHGVNLHSSLSLSDSDGKCGLFDTLSRLEARLGIDLPVLCHFPTHTSLKTLHDLTTFLSHKPLPERLSMLQFAPTLDFDTRIHRLDVEEQNGRLVSRYSQGDLAGNKVQTGDNERICRKVQAETKRLIAELERRTDGKVALGSFTFVMVGGEAWVQYVEKVVVVQGKDTERREERIGRHMKTNRQWLKDEECEVLSPRVRSPALTCPNSPRSQSRTEGSTTPRLPAVSPRASPFFNTNFKEMLALTLDKQRKKPGSLTHRCTPLTQIEELIKDDERFFQFVGLEGKRDDGKELGVSRSEAGMSTASTNCSVRTDSKRRTIIKKKPPLPRVFRPVLSPPPI